MDATITLSLPTIAMAKPARLGNSEPPLSRSQRRNVVATSQKANVLKVFLQSAKEASALTIQRSIDGASVNLQRQPPQLLQRRLPQRKPPQLLQRRQKNRPQRQRPKKLLPQRALRQPKRPQRPPLPRQSLLRRQKNRPQRQRPKKLLPQR